MQKALLRAMLMPRAELKEAEAVLDFTKRLVLTEEFKDLPMGAVWAEFCDRHDVPNGLNLASSLETYQASVSSRG